MPKKKPATDKKVAVIGSGPAGLTTAYYLAKQGHAVTVFEQLPLAGGMMRYGIPAYRLARHVLDAEIAHIEKAGVKIRTGVRVASAENLLEEGYDAVLVAVGASKGHRLRLAGADSRGVLVGVDFLKDVNMGKPVTVGDKVVVVGGGNVAFDCARVARRLGAEQVHMACLECKAQMPAACDEIEQGEDEGIIIHPSRTFTRIVTEGGKVAGAAFRDVCSFEFDEDNRLHIDVVEGSDHVIEGDTVILAIGQRPDIPEDFGVETTEAGLVDIDPHTLSTDVDGVFAAGDAVTGTASVIKAVAAGRKAAVAMDKFLDGNGRIDEILAPRIDPEKWLGPDRDFAALSRCEPVCLLAEQRVQSFCSVIEDMDEQTARRESRRCLQCDLRLAIKPVKFWGEY